MPNFGKRRDSKGSSKKTLIIILILTVSILLVLLWQLGFFEAIADWWNGIG